MRHGLHSGMITWVCFFFQLNCLHPFFIHLQRNNVTYKAYLIIIKPFKYLGGRLDTTCMNANIGGIRQVIVAGGWNNIALTDTGVFSNRINKWVFFNGTLASNPLPLPLRSSAIIERNQTSILLGGVTCDVNGRKCKQTDSG